MSLLIRWRRAAVGLAFLGTVIGCSAGKPDPYEGALLVPVPVSDRHELAAFLAGFSHQAGYYLRDSSNYMKDTTGTVTFWIVAYRGLDDGKEWAEIQGSATGDEYPIITFNRPSRPALSAAADRAWSNLISAAKERWPSAGQVPILPHGGIPHARDLILKDGIYRISSDRASDYDLAITDRLVAPSQPAETRGDPLYSLNPSIAM